MVSTGALMEELIERRLHRGERIEITPGDSCRQRFIRRCLEAEEPGIIHPQTEEVARHHQVDDTPLATFENEGLPHDSGQNPANSAIGDDRVAAIRPLPVRQGDNRSKLVREGDQIFVAGQMGRLSKYTS